MLKYETYCNLSPSPVSEGDFDRLIILAETKFLFLVGEEKQCAEMVLTQFVDVLKNHQKTNIEYSSYSNGVESVTYKENSEKALNHRLWQIAKESLQICRCV